MAIDTIGLQLFLKTHDLHDTDDIESLLEVMDLTRELLGSGQYDTLSELIRYAVTEGCWDALSWILSLLQEAYEADDAPEDFDCGLGRSIPDYDGFLKSLEVDPDLAEYDVEKEFDDVGEERSFFNNSTHRTRYGNIYFVSSENIDYLDSDYIEYRLSFRRDPGALAANEKEADA